MKFTTLICVALTLIVVVHSEKYFSDVFGESITKIGPTLDVKPPTNPAFSSGVLMGAPFMGTYEENSKYTVVLSAPPAFPILAAIRVLDLRPNRADTLTLFVPGDDKLKRIFQNTNDVKTRTVDEKEMDQFFAYNGKLGVTFQTGPGSTEGYEGFELVYTAQANATCENGHMFYFTCKNKRCIYRGLKCNHHNNCGDWSDEDEDACPSTATPKTAVSVEDNFISSGLPDVPDDNDLLPKTIVLKKTAGQIAGIVCGVLFALIVVGGVIAFIIFRRASARRSTQGAVVGNAGYR